ncbi:16S rRNA (cytidine(1402)-2'-O)-methyltransferase [candidate division KSB1 bacterium]|nr:MAG: 16S rRNA (cytidine(1402)-2'-O)-methyltransferase [candidate division KSB1 bacterium]
MAETVKTAGVLYIVSTPIGNLEDITLRALRVLKEADIIAAEDTRHTGLLLKHFDIKNRIVSYHDHNKERSGPRLIERLLQGENIAVVSDAGTPGISDPAFYLVRLAKENSITVSPVPGPSALISGLVVSGLPTDRFVFEGFLPVKKNRKTRLNNLAEEDRTIVLYESPYRLLKTLKDLKETLGNRKVAVCRELTKKFEEIVSSTLDEAFQYFSSKSVRGEFVLIIQGNKIKK